MKIIVLDGHTLNPGDLSWDDLKSQGDCTIYDRTPPARIIERAAGAEIILTNKTPITAATIQSLPALKYIGVLATGYNIIDIAAAKARGIVVTNVPAYGTPSVVQTTFALLLELTHHVGDHTAAVHTGRWTASPDFTYYDSPLTELNNLTMGIVGFGDIGRAVAGAAQSFGMRILVHTRTTRPSEKISFVDLPTLFKTSDVITLHCPLTPATQNLINATNLAMIKHTALLINTARGALIDEPALATALNEKRIAGAALDVLSTEPPPASNPLLTAKNCIITPHIGWATKAARARLMRAVTQNLKAFLDGHPVNQV